MAPPTPTRAAVEDASRPRGEGSRRARATRRRTEANGPQMRRCGAFRAAWPWRDCRALQQWPLSLGCAVRSTPRRTMRVPRDPTCDRSLGLFVKAASVRQPRWRCTESGFDFDNYGVTAASTTDHDQAFIGAAVGSASEVDLDKAGRLARTARPHCLYSVTAARLVRGWFARVLPQATSAASPRPTSIGLGTDRACRKPTPASSSHVGLVEFSRGGWR